MPVYRYSSVRNPEHHFYVKLNTLSSLEREHVIEALSWVNPNHPLLEDVRNESSMNFPIVRSNTDKVLQSQLIKVEKVIPILVTVRESYISIRK